MDSPWQILGLDADSATEKDVKVAYARLIKVHRPDADPEGFQRVRNAYETALAMLKSGQRHGFAGDDDDGESSHAYYAGEGTTTGPAESLPPELIEVDLAVARAREANDEPALQKAVASLQALCRNLRPGQAGWQLWKATLHRVTEGKSALVAGSLPVWQLINELESGSAAITHVVVGYWEDNWDTDRLISLAEGILAEKARLQNGEAGVVALRLGIAIGFVKPAFASMLITFAFPHLDRDAREGLIPKVEEQAAIGNLMIGLRKDQQQFWHRRVRQPRSEWDWNSLQATEALNYLVTDKGPHWSGYGIVKQIVPEDWFTKLEKEMGRVRGGITGRLKPPTLGNPRPVSEPSTGSSPWRFAWIAFLVLSSLARMIPHSESRTPARPYPTSSQPSSRQLHPPLERKSAFTPQSSSPTFPSSSPVSTGVVMPYRLKQSKEIADKARTNGKPLDVWFNRAIEIDQETTKIIADNPKSNVLEVRKKSLGKVTKLFDEMRTATHDSALERRLMDVLLYDPAVSGDLRTAALYRMSKIEAPDVFLPKWEQAAELSNPAAKTIGFVAGRYLQSPVRPLLEDERQRLEQLAKAMK